MSKQADNTAAFLFLRRRIDEAEFGDPLCSVPFRSLQPLSDVMQAYADHCIEQEHVNGCIPAGDAEKFVRQLENQLHHAQATCTAINDTIEMLTGRRA